MKKRVKKPWPTKDAMEQVYEKKLWGGSEKTDFFSGAGSHLPELVDPYVDVVKKFLTSFKNPLTVCDLGCGDFNVGKEFVPYTAKYIAIDIVPDLIARNQEKFKGTGVEFLCMDISKEKLPAGDCALIRQVLQHLSNAEVQRILEKLNQFQYILLTEHLPNGAFIPNKDIISGQGIRLKKKSGLDVLKPPFNFRIKSEKIMVCIDLGNRKGKIITKLFQT